MFLLSKPDFCRRLDAPKKAKHMASTEQKLHKAEERKSKRRLADTCQNAVFEHARKRLKMKNAADVKASEIIVDFAHSDIHVLESSRQNCERC